MNPRFHFEKILSILFSDNNSIGLMKLLEPILKNDKFMSKPKMVINDFCRGNSKDDLAKPKDIQRPKNNLPKKVNYKESF